ncbi:outer membrane lipoprotein-sorting protein [Agaribacterium haliotis]|uniref:outer membrane lipoprotein-sorting protein n=1 Tax=Agaribacterium haliotis TaxID=2013869 RepID=UPI000BB55D2F|nr:outer membrane lipoprotein-sorting protein [Agaribacterium haliotis]
MDIGVFSVCARRFFLRAFLYVSVFYSNGILADTRDGQAASVNAAEPDARELIQKSMDLWRGKTSYSEVSMTIHRPDWQRSMSMQAWTEGEKNSLVRVSAPARDAGNASLIKDRDMWSFAPKINRVIKVPSSMMAQSWMGSDFSNKDISRNTDIINLYDHSLAGQSNQDGHLVYEIHSVPHEAAAVVWGKEVLFIRDDYVLLEQQYWDQDGKLVKTMKTIDFMQADGRTIAKTMRMNKSDDKNSWTQIENTKVQFDIELSSSTFTLSNLRNPRL